MDTVSRESTPSAANLESLVTKESSGRASCFLTMSHTFFTVSGDVPRVDGQLAVARAFSDKSLKMHIYSEPNVLVEEVDPHTYFLILASDEIWKVLHF
ncbi:hypothetical protein RJT34_30545 [Clitoria ternatea]|uniref:PPM-type phosphatase domain-containing protein n=1 Tax=Clitoria ternatea TaxID=43366 RepID=A0AAN9ET09_CLITE